MKDLESLESTQGKLQGDRPPPETPCRSQSNLRVPTRVIKLRLAQFTLKTAHLAMEPRGPGASALLLRLWLQYKPVPNKQLWIIRILKSFFIIANFKSYK